ncbi:hypothetical protein [Telmatospirillum sp.]|uniref:hypothetical protein n=1 Tax=Telmatospirillum sp. TaxID=2079197 RepID=UPI00283CA729|nr:hypothetical protein [Telmatospirillum sp.]MDR3435834.1 hypothetical protein [Telmatospirillum sp.]
MPVRIQISLLIYMVVQGALFGIGALLVLATPLTAFAMQLLPWVVGVTALMSIPLSYLIAPHLLARFEGRFAFASSINHRL